MAEAAPTTLITCCRILLVLLYKDYLFSGAIDASPFLWEHGTYDVIRCFSRCRGQGVGGQTLQQRRWL